MKLSKKVIVITGGNSGLGKATAKILSGKNKVIILGREIKEVARAARELKCEGIICDVTNSGQIKNAFAQIIKKYKKIDCLINCAGVWIEGAIEKNDPEEIKNVFAVNTLGTIFTVNAIVPQLKKQKHGRIINIISDAGLKAAPGRSVYYSSKWAVTGFTKCLRIDLAKFNIGVFGFYPGFIHTGLFEKAGNSRKSYKKAMPVGKTAEAVAYMVDVDQNLSINALELQSLEGLK